METKKRIDFIDLAKGVCIILVVMFHSGINIPFLEYIRMPLYFIISGIFFKKYEGFVGFLVRKINKIIIPFTFFFCLSYLLYYVLGYFWPNVPLDKNIDCFYLTDPIYSHIMFNHPLWFLLALFGSNILFYLLQSVTCNLLLQGIGVLLLAILGISLRVADISLPFYFNESLTYFPFFHCGYLLKGTPILYKNQYDRYNWYFIGAALLLFFTGFQMEWGKQYVIIGYIMSIVGVLAVLLFCKKLGRLPIISYYGRYSIVILCTHSLVDRPVRFMLTHGFEGMDSHLVLILTFVLTLAIELPVIYLCINHLGYVTAQKDVIPLKWVASKEETAQ